MFSPSSLISVYNNAYAGYDSFSVTAFGPTLAATGSPAPATVLTFGLSDSTGSRFSTAALPAGVSLAGFDLNIFSIDFRSATDDFVVAGDVLSAGAAAAVPEPQTWALMLTSIGVVGFAARRRRR